MSRSRRIRLRALQWFAAAVLVGNAVDVAVRFFVPLGHSSWLTPLGAWGAYWLGRDVTEDLTLKRVH